MMSYISENFYEKSYVMKWCQQVMGLEWDEVEKVIQEELPGQFFPETATWGLMYHEQKWQLPIRMNLKYEERRKLIYQKRDYRAPMTPYKMEAYVEKILGVETHVLDCHDRGTYGFKSSHPNIFKVVFVTERTLDTASAFGVIDRIKQSHTVYTVNDRMEIVADNSNLESFMLGNRFGMSVPFWGGYVFDGIKLFDGSILADGKRRYGLVLSMWNVFSICYIHKNIKLFVVSFTGQAWLYEWIYPGIRSRMAACLLDICRHNVQASMVFHMRTGLPGLEKIQDISIETKSKDYKFFDGSILADGTKRFDSVYRKETME